MNTKKVAAEYRLSQWAQVIQAQMDSGQNIKDFCQTAGIKKRIILLAEEGTRGVFYR